MKGEKTPPHLFCPFLFSFYLLFQAVSSPVLSSYSDLYVCCVCEWVREREREVEEEVQQGGQIKFWKNSHLKMSLIWEKIVEKYLFL